MPVSARRRAAAVAPLVGCAALVCACGSAAAPPRPSPSLATGTPTVQAVALTVALRGQPERSFGAGHWRVCDHGTVANPSSLVARDVRVVVTYMDHGIVDGQTTRADATGNGGALGDMQPGQSKDFTVCGYSRNEPDQDVVRAEPGP